MLCTANQCRSPMAEALLAQRLDAASVSDADPLEDVAGRIGGAISAFRRTADEIDGLLARIVRDAWAVG